MNPRPDTKDPGFERFRTRSYHTEMFMKKYSKTKKLEDFSQGKIFVLEFFDVFFIYGITLDPTTTCMYVLVR